MRHRRAWFVTEALTGFSNVHDLLSPKSPVEYGRLMGDWRISGEQRLRWEVPRMQISSACRLGRASGPSRGAFRIAAHIQENLLPLEGAGYEEHLSRMAATVAKPIEADRIKVPTVGAAIVPEKF